LHDIKAVGQFGNQGRGPAQNPARFDYGAPAELFPSRSKAGKSRARYMRFDSAMEALRFVFEKMPASALPGAYLIINERRFGVQEMRCLYESAGSPLARSAAAAC
jgi:hypothetical protein